MFRTLRVAKPNPILGLSNLVIHARALLKMGRRGTAPVLVLNNMGILAK